MAKSILLVTTMIFVALTPAVIAFTRAHRGSDAIGSEVFFPLLPLLVWFLGRVIADMFREVENLMGKEVNWREINKPKSQKLQRRQGL